MHAVLRCVPFLDVVSPDQVKVLVSKMIGKKLAEVDEEDLSSFITADKVGPDNLLLSASTYAPH